MSTAVTAWWTLQYFKFVCLNVECHDFATRRNWSEVRMILPSTNVGGVPAIGLEGGSIECHCCSFNELFYIAVSNVLCPGSSLYR